MTKTDIEGFKNYLKWMKLANLILSGDLENLNAHIFFDGVPSIYLSSCNNWALRFAAFAGHLPVVKYLVEEHLVVSRTKYLDVLFVAYY